MKIIHYILFVCFLLPSCKNNKRNMIAEFEGVPVYQDEVDIMIEPKLYHHLSNIYADRSAVLNGLIEKKILSAEASKRNMSYDAFIDSLYTHDKNLRSISDNLPENDYFQKKSKEYQVGRTKSLIRRKWADSLSPVYHVKKNLVLPQKNYYTDLNGIKCQIRGNKDAKAVLWVISDYDCFNCKELQPVYDSIYQMYQGEIKFASVFFSEGVTQASIVAECAALQGKYWEMGKYLYQNNKANDLKLWIHVADSLQMDTAKFRRDFNDPAVYDAINKNIDMLHDRKIYGTPTIVMNNKIHMNILSVKQLQQIIDKQLKKQ